MERKFHQDDLDQFLKNNADDLRMRPSGAVWEGISKELNRKKRRVAALLLTGLTLLSGGLFTWYTLHLPNDKTAVNNPAATEQSAPANPNRSQTIYNNGIIIPAGPAQQQAKANNAGTNHAAVLPFSNTNKTANEGTAQNPVATTLENDEVAAPNESEAFASRPATAPATLLLADRVSMNDQLQRGPKLPVAPPAAEAEATADVAASLPKAKKKRLLSWSVFATPTVSYRKLSENKTFDRPFLTPGTPPMVSALYNINNAVIHKPDLGLEFGVAAKYALTKKLKLRSGFQFNISRYDIKAFSYIPEVATIALSNGFGVDSVRAVSSYRNFNNGSVSDWLQNMYFQASLPVGLEYEVVSGKKVKWNVAGAIQPTYIIGNRSYMITADYKNYARVPWLTRHWNMNTNVETFVTFQSGKTEWHIGPQMRYQALSSFVKKYPVKENLFDFGMKVGVTIR